MSDALTSAVKAWCTVLGEENVSIDRQRRLSAATATFPTTQQVPAILRPADRQQVQECLRIANRFTIPVYPISSGKNWGYGSAVPVETNCAVLDLSRLDQIVDYDDQLGFVTIEPGVTQRKLYDFLHEKGGKFWMDATGASEACSIIGNTLERGFGHTPYSDHLAHACALEVVLPSGDCLHTGLSRFSNARAKRVYRWGLGPYIDGLFTQSGLGIVTQMTVWLMPAPEYFQTYFFSIEEDGALEELIDALLPLRLKGTINSAVHIGNTYRVLSSIQQYPWKEAEGRTPLPQRVLEQLGERWDFGAWNGSGALYGARREVAESRRQIKKALKGKVKKLRFIDDKSLNRAELLQYPLKFLLRVDVPEMLKLVRPVHNMMKGIPTDKIIASTYWRKKGAVPTSMDPNRDRCGLIWCSPISPTSGKHARLMANTATETLLKYGFEPGMTMTLLTERSLENVISIAYDRDVEGEDERAMACHRELLNRLTQEGFYPYRLGTHSMKSLPPTEETYATFQTMLKKTLDPNGILAPGRYEA